MTASSASRRPLCAGGDRDELVYINASVEIYDPAGPTLADIGVQFAVQGAASD